MSDPEKPGEEPLPAADVLLPLYQPSSGTITGTYDANAPITWRGVVGLVPRRPGIRAQ